MPTYLDVRLYHRLNSIVSVKLMLCRYLFSTGALKVIGYSVDGDVLAITYWRGSSRITIPGFMCQEISVSQGSCRGWSRRSPFGSDLGELR